MARTRSWTHAGTRRAARLCLSKTGVLMYFLRHDRVWRGTLLCGHVLVVAGRAREDGRIWTVADRASAERHTPGEGLWKVCCEYGNADMSRVHTMDVEQGHRCVCGCGGQAAHVVMRVPQCRCRGVAGFVLGRLLRVRCCFVSGWRSGAPRKAPQGVPLPCQGLVGGYGSGISSLVSNRLKAAVCMFSHCMLGLRAVDMLVNWILDLCRTWAWVPRGGSSAGHVCGAICSG